MLHAHSGLVSEWDLDKYGTVMIDLSDGSSLTRTACMQRVVLLSFDKDTGRISFRHYSISAAPSGVTKSVKSLVNRRQLPNMGALGDVSELLTKSGYGSVLIFLTIFSH